MGGYTHVGHLWSSSGTLLATANFTNESSYGWQQVSFSNPVSIAANTAPGIVSFSTGGGYFGITTTGLAGSGVTNGPLTALSSAAAGGNGVYASGNGAFPSINGRGMNFWADVVFSPSSSPSAVVGPAVAPSAANPFFIASSPSGRSVAAASAGSAGSVASAGQAGVRIDPRAVPQATTLSSFRKKGGLFGPVHASP